MAVPWLANRFAAGFLVGGSQPTRNFLVGFCWVFFLQENGQETFNKKPGDSRDMMKL